MTSCDECKNTIVSCDYNKCDFRFDSGDKVFCMEDDEGGHKHFHITSCFVEYVKNYYDVVETVATV